MSHLLYLFIIYWFSCILLLISCINPPIPNLFDPFTIHHPESIISTTSKNSNYPQFYQYPYYQYSKFRCLGGRQRESGLPDRSCYFHNLCYKPSQDEWLYYTDPNEKEFPVIINDLDGTFQSEFPKHFLNLRSLGNEEDARYWAELKTHSWAPRRLYESIPTPEAFAPRKHLDRGDIHILYHPHFPSNLGHVIGDDLFPIYNLMSSFGLLTNDSQLIIQRDCDKIFPKIPKKSGQCHKFLNMLLPGLSQRQYLAATQNDFAERLGVDPKLDLVCFENLLAGLGGGFQQSLGKASMWWGYHNFYLSNMGINPNHTPKKHRITVSIKKGKRGLHNNDELIHHLKSKLTEYDIDAIELKSLDGWKNELTYLQDTTVLVTPCGGVSMSSMFMPHNSALVVVDYYSTKVNASVGMEERLWTNLGYIRSYHYPFNEKEVYLPDKRENGNLLHRDDFADMRDYGEVKVDLPRMTQIVKSAIAHVDNFMTMGQT